MTVPERLIGVVYKEKIQKKMEGELCVMVDRSDPFGDPLLPDWVGRMKEGSFIYYEKNILPL